MLKHGSLFAIFAGFSFYVVEVGYEPMTPLWWDKYSSHHANPFRMMIVHSINLQIRWCYSCVYFIPKYGPWWIVEPLRWGTGGLALAENTYVLLSGSITVQLTSSWTALILSWIVTKPFATFLLVWLNLVQTGGQLYSRLPFIECVTIIWPLQCLKNDLHIAWTISYV